MRALKTTLIPIAVLWCVLPRNPARGQTMVDPALEITTYSFGALSFPTFFTFLPADSGGPADMLVCENQTGRVKLFRDGWLQGVVVDLAVSFGNERGLFGIAVHPGFPDPPWVYVYYSSSTTGTDTNVYVEALDNRVERYSWDGSTLSSPQLLLSLPVFPGPNHNGGVLVFGPDGMLYGSIGDLNHNGQLQNFPNGPPPDDTSIIFRIQDDGTPPSDNPFFAMGGAIQKVYSYGNRNVFGLDFDPLTGILWNTDNGPDVYDEINMVPAGFNSGWEEIMGPADRSPGSVENLWAASGSQYSDPEFSWLDSFGVTTAHFLRGDSLGPHYKHDFFMASQVSGDVYHFDVSGDRMSLVMPDASVADLVADNATERDLFLFIIDVGLITDIDTGPDGALYLVGSGDQRIYRVARQKTSDAGGDDLHRTRTHRLVFSPNPFHGRTLARLVGADPRTRGLLHIYGPAGRLVRALELHGSTVSWDGLDAGGQPVAAGVYMVRLQRGPGLGPVESKVVRVR